MKFTAEKNALTAKRGGETLRIEKTACGYGP